MPASVNTASNGTTNPITQVAVPAYGSKVTDTSGNTGIAKFNPNTGQALPQANTATIGNGSSTSKSNLGIANPISTQSTTTLSSDKSNDIATANTTTDNLSKSGITTEPTSGVATYANGEVVPQPQETPTPTTPTSTTSTGGYVGDIYYPPGSTAPTDSNGQPMPLAQMSTADQQNIEGLLTLKSQADANTADAISLAQAQYQDLINQSEQQQATFQNSNIMSGNAATSPNNARGIMSAGIAELGKLNFEKLQAINAAKVAGQNQDVALQEKMNAAAQNTADKQQTAFKDLQDKLATAAKNAQDEADKFRDYNLNVSKFNNDIANSKISQTLDQAKFDETIKSDAFDQAYKTEDLALKKQTLEAAQGEANFQSSLPIVQTTGTGAPNAAAQANFLAALPGGANGAMATGIKGLSNYTINPSSFSTRIPSGGGLSQRQQMITMAAQYDPTFDETQYNSRQALRTNFESGNYSKNINSLNTAIGHLTDLLSASNKLGNVGFTALNTVKNATEKAFGSGNITAAETNLAASAGELASTFKGSGATDAEIAQLGNISANASPEQFKAYIEKGTELLSSRLNALTDTYTSGMGKPPATPFLSDTSAKSLLGLKAQGLNIDVPALDDTPAGQIYNLGISNPSIQPQVTKMEQNGVSSQAILDWINSGSTQ